MVVIDVPSPRRWDALAPNRAKASVVDGDARGPRGDPREAAGGRHPPFVVSRQHAVGRALERLDDLFHGVLVRRSSLT
jgi:hypothetical protein